MKLLLFCLLILALNAGRYEDEIERKKQITAKFWENDVSIWLNNWQRGIVPVDPDVVPLATYSSLPFMVYVERCHGKALIIPQVLVDKMLQVESEDPLVKQWLGIMFNGNVKNLTSDREVRDGRGIVLRDIDGDFEVEELYNAWTKGKTGPLILQSTWSHDRTKGIVKMAEFLGCYLHGGGQGMGKRPTKDMVYEPVGYQVPELMRVLYWIDDIESVNQFSLNFAPSRVDGGNAIKAKSPKLGQYIMEILLKYQDLFNANVPTNLNQHKLNDPTMNISRNALNLYTDLLRAQNLYHVPEKERAKLNINYQFLEIYNEEGVMPETGEYEFTLTDMPYKRIPIGVTALKNSIVEFEVLEGNASKIILSYGHLTDDLYNKGEIKRLPSAYGHMFMENQKYRMYVGAGGILSIQDKGEHEKIKIRFKNVVQTPTVDIRRPETTIEWDSGKFENTKLKWINVVCDTVIFTFDIKGLKGWTGKQVEDICTTYDTFIKAMINFSGNPQKDRMYIVFDIQPSHGAAHAGYPIVCGPYWEQHTLDKVPLFIAKKPAGWWGILHEIGHNLQRGVWTYPGFVDVTNNVLVLYGSENFAGMGPGSDKLNNVYRNNQSVANFLMDLPKAIHPLFGYLHCYAQLRLSFGWALVGNAWNKFDFVNNERSVERWVEYLTEDTQMNMVPYLYWFKFDQFFTDIKASYEQYKHLPVYRPEGGILDYAMEKWNKTREFFGFSEDHIANVTIDYNFDVDKNINTIKQTDITFVKL